MITVLLKNITMNTSERVFFDPGIEQRFINERIPPNLVIPNIDSDLYK